MIPDYASMQLYHLLMNGKLAVLLKTLFISDTPWIGISQCKEYQNQEKNQVIMCDYTHETKIRRIKIKLRTNKKMLQTLLSDELFNSCNFMSM